MSKVDSSESAERQNEGWLRPLCASAIADFVQRQAQRTTTKHALNAVSALRSFLEALTPSRGDRHQLGRVRAHYCDLVAIECTEVPSRRADPTGLELL